MNSTYFLNNFKDNQVGQVTKNMMNFDCDEPKRRRSTSKGRWTNEEHEVFIKCLKKYGKNWKKLEQNIPSKASIQIRSHLQKYFNQIKKEYNTNNPMEYIQKNMCDNSNTYKFENFDINTNPQSYTTNDLQGFSTNDPQNFMNSENPHLQSMERTLEFKEESSREVQGPKKRISKMNKKNLEYFNESNDREDERRNQKHLTNEEKEHQKMFKIQKISKYGSDSSSNDVSDGQKNNSINTFGSFKIPTSISTDSQTQERKQENFLIFNKGSLTIQRNEIETSVPCKIRKIGNKISMISPLYPARVYIEPIYLQDSMVFDTDKQNFKTPNISMHSMPKQKNTNENKYKRNKCESRKSEEEIIKGYLKNLSLITISI